MEPLPLLLLALAMMAMLLKDVQAKVVQPSVRLFRGWSVACMQPRRPPTHSGARAPGGP